MVVLDEFGFDRVERLESPQAASLLYKLINVRGERSTAQQLHPQLRVASPAFQAMDTQLNALPILPVLARTVSGCLNSAFLGLF
jgi:hypothetical protein